MTASLWPLWGLVFARTAGLLTLAPPTGWRHFPPALRVAAAAVLAVPLTLTAAPATTLALPLGAYAACVVREAMVGLLLGLGPWLLVWAAYAAGHIQDVVGGLAGDGEEDGPLARLFMAMALVFFVQLNGLHRLVAFVHRSYGLLPPGPALPVADVAGPGLFFTSMLQLAAPAVLATLLAAVMVASLQRVLPDMRAAELLPAARAVVTLLALIAVAPLLGAVLLHQLNVIGELSARWLAGHG